MGGYVGNSADVKRIRKLTEQREQERKRVEGLINASDEAVTGAGLRKFGVGTSEVLESVFKAETVGLVTKELWSGVLDCNGGWHYCGVGTRRRR
eukprot:CAMPEP_0177792766 /NCGR_PEP_ID=MMETSP0491_2-20121128/24702_1 /TAXON_ID=63592 /ORGANISM="Tetraselmis chuii, Strain PLY429" /LENGTH=93 /DNA_ID=CAMNT_0019315207 /DNA_START=105 /DNA_END=382 /DNA_ORIENTATION=+